MTELSSSLGEQLKKAREGLGYNIEAIADYLKIRTLYLKALESGNFEEIPSPVYVIGFLRTYGKFLGLNAEELVVLYKREVRGIRPSLEFVTPLPMREKNMPSKILVISSIIAAIIILGIYELTKKGEVDEESYYTTITRPTSMMLAEIGEGDLPLMSPSASGRMTVLRRHSAIICAEVCVSKMEKKPLDELSYYCEIPFDEYIPLLTGVSKPQENSIFQE